MREVFAENIERIDSVDGEGHLGGLEVGRRGAGCCKPVGRRRRMAAGPTAIRSLAGRVGAAARAASSARVSASLRCSRILRRSSGLK